MNRHDTITLEESIITAKKMRPSLTMRQIADALGTNKSTVGRILKASNEGRCPRCGCACRGVRNDQ